MAAPEINNYIEPNGIDFIAELSPEVEGRVYIYTAENTSAANGMTITTLNTDPLYKVNCVQPILYGVSGKQGIDYDRMSSEIRAVLAQLSDNSWKETTTEYKEYLYNNYAGYFLTKIGSKYMAEFEKKTGIKISKDGDYAKWEYVKK